MFAMSPIIRDTGCLYELAAKCRRLASYLTNEVDVAILKRMATEYETQARLAQSDENRRSFSL